MKADHLVINSSIQICTTLCHSDAPSKHILDIQMSTARLCVCVCVAMLCRCVCTAVGYLWRRRMRESEQRPEVGWLAWVGVWEGFLFGKDPRPSYLTFWFRKTSWLHVFAAVDGLVGWKREHFKSSHVKAQRFWQWTAPHFHVKIKMKVKVKFPRFTTFQSGVQSCSCATLPQLASVYITERQH